MKEEFGNYFIEDSISDIKDALDYVCELLVELINSEKKCHEEVKKEEALEFRPAKIGADIGEEQEDVIAKIFGNI